MPYREVGVVDLREALRRWLAGEGIRSDSSGNGAGSEYDSLPTCGGCHSGSSPAAAISNAGAGPGPL